MLIIYFASTLGRFLECNLWMLHMAIQEKRRISIAQQWGNVQLTKSLSCICVVNGAPARNSVWNHVQEVLQSSCQLYS